MIDPAKVLGDEVKKFGILSEHQYLYATKGISFQILLIVFLHNAFWYSLKVWIISDFLFCKYFVVVISRSRFSA